MGRGGGCVFRYTKNKTHDVESLCVFTDSAEGLINRDFCSEQIRVNPLSLPLVLHWSLTSPVHGLLLVSGEKEIKASFLIKGKIVKARNCLHEN